MQPIAWFPLGILRIIMLKIRVFVDDLMPKLELGEALLRLLPNVCLPHRSMFFIL